MQPTNTYLCNSRNKHFERFINIGYKYWISLQIYLKKCRIKFLHTTQIHSAVTLVSEYWTELVGLVRSDSSLVLEAYIKDEGIQSWSSEQGVLNICAVSSLRKKKSSYPTQGEEMTLIKNVSDLVWPVTQD